MKVKIFIIMVVLVFSTQVKAYFFETANTIEVNQARIIVTASGTGFAQGRACQQCPLMKFKVTPDVLAFDLQNNQVDLREANKWSGKAVLFTYDKQSKKLLKIVQQRGIE